MANRRITVSLTWAVPEDGAFLVQYFSRPSARRQEWLRRHLVAPGSGQFVSYVPCSPDMPHEGPEAETIEIRLTDDMPEEAAAYTQYLQVPSSRRPEWVRQRLFRSVFGRPFDLTEDSGAALGEARGGPKGVPAGHPSSPQPAAPPASRLAGLMLGEPPPDDAGA